MATELNEDIRTLVAGLNFAEKVERSMSLIRQAHAAHGDGLVAANSLGNDSCAVWPGQARQPRYSRFHRHHQIQAETDCEIHEADGDVIPELRVYQSDERAGRWIGTSKCGGECGIHTRLLKIDPQT
jgi:hypothetical protein